jgi:hypothetical protein
LRFYQVKLRFEHWRLRHGLKLATLVLLVAVLSSIFAMPFGEQLQLQATPGTQDEHPPRRADAFGQQDGRHLLQCVEPGHQLDRAFGIAGNRLGVGE